MKGSKRHITFIINPISGTTKKKNIPSLITELFDPLNSEVVIRHTEYAGHAQKIAAELSQQDTEIIAVGGDGTINEIVNGIKNSGATMGIIPTGSGNGLARHIGIPMNARKAMDLVKIGFTQTIDLMYINEEFSANVSGVGFDALVAHQFSNSKSRGFLNYAKISLGEFFKYKPKEYQISIDGKDYTRKAFLLSLANSSQFGNNAYIAPQASLKDGLIDVCILKPFSFIAAIEIFGRMMTKSLHKSKFLEIIQGKNIQIKNEASIYHLDGDPRESNGSLNIELLPSILKLIVPETSKL